MSLPFATRLARRIRHLPGLRGFDGLWRALRPAYHRLLDPSGRGVAVEIGRRRIRLPAAVLACHPDWTRYELPTFERISTWFEGRAGDTMFFDIGSSYGVITSFVLQNQPRARVIAFDGDAMSLRSMEAVVPRAAHSRLQRVLGLLGTRHHPARTLADAVRATTERLPAVPPSQAISRSTYVCIGGDGADALPQYRLDDLLAGTDLPDQLLVKCDVEGAELLVLEGARRILSRFRPEILLSVHPPFLPRHGHSVEAVARFLSDLGYEWTCYDRDHEEHWHARPAR